MIGHRAGDRPVTALDIACQRIVEDAGAKYLFIWDCTDTLGYKLVAFNSRFSGSTLYIRLEDLTAVSVKEHLDESDAKFGRILCPPPSDFLAELRALFLARTQRENLIHVPRIWTPTGPQLRRWIERVRQSVSRQR